jgi:hypothetical protein
MRTTHEPRFAFLNRKLGAVILMSIILLLAHISLQTAFAATGDWSMSGFDATNASYNPDTTINANNVNRLTRGWSGGSGLYRAPQVIVGDGLTVATSYGIQVYNTSTGVLLWHVTSGYPPNVSAIANGVLYVCDSNGIQAFTATTGTLIWTATNMCGSHSLTLANGLLYVASNRLSALNPSDGTTVWSSPLYGTAVTASVIANGIVYIGSRGSSWPIAYTLQAVNATTGASVWANSLSTAPTTIAAINGSVYLVRNTAVYTYDPNTGALLKTIGFPSTIVSLAITSHNEIVVGTNTGSVDLLDQFGHIWPVQISSSNSSVSVAVAGGIIYATTWPGTFAIADVTPSPQVLWSDSMESGFMPVISHGILYVSNSSGFQTYHLP